MIDLGPVTPSGPPLRFGGLIRRGDRIERVIPGISSASFNEDGDGGATLSFPFGWFTCTSRLFPGRNLGHNVVLGTTPTQLIHLPGESNVTFNIPVRKCLSQEARWFIANDELEHATIGNVSLDYPFVSIPADGGTYLRVRGSLDQCTLRAVGDEHPALSGLWFIGVRDDVTVGSIELSSQLTEPHAGLDVAVIIVGNVKDVPIVIGDHEIQVFDRGFSQSQGKLNFVKIVIDESGAPGVRVEFGVQGDRFDPMGRF